ncbi:CYP63 cytochrome P450 monooxygenase-like protein [Gautieria morchelliformis]|nr:CYP63 cytochrome P450 monooxygenase-like protein [Gautieria morchelliformis]
MAVTPGVYFLVTTLIPVLFCPPLVYWSVVSVTPGVLVCVYLFSLPVCLSAASWLRRIKVALAARRLGARVAGRADGVLPWNIDLLVQGITINKSDYLGDPILGAFKLAGGTDTCSLEILGDDRLLTMNPDNIKKVLATDFENYRKGSLFNGIMEAMLGVGVFNSDGEMWQFHRKMTRPFFSKERVTDLILYERMAATALQKMQERFDAGLAVDFQVGSIMGLHARFTLDAASEFLLGASVNSLDPPLPMPHNVPNSAAHSEFSSTPSTRFARAFATAQVTLLSRLELGNIWPLAEIRRHKLQAPMAEIRAFIDPIVRNAMNKRKADGTKDEKTLLGHLLDVTGDMKVIVDETLNILIAGRDTTASLLTFVCYCLAMHPEVLRRLRQEILETVGNVRAPSYDQLRSMKYLRAVLNETLRLFPPVPFNMRETINETTWCDDSGRKIYVPPNTRLVYSVLNVHRSETYWGPDAYIYDPDRWLDSRVQRYTSNPFTFIPFNAGPRICLGQQFAYHETSFFVVRFLQRFEHIELAPESQPPQTRIPEKWKDPSVGSPLNKRRPLEQCLMRSHLTMYADGGLWIRAKQVEPVEAM